jgi:hypothetical protein
MHEKPPTSSECFLRTEKSRVIFSVILEFLALWLAFLDAFIAAGWQKPFALLSLTFSRSIIPGIGVAPD